MATQLNMVRTAVTAVASSGLGAFTIGTASAGYRTFGAAQDGRSFTCQISEGNAWEVRTGCVYTSSGTTLSRGTLEDSSSGSAVTFTTACIVRVVVSAADFTTIQNPSTLMRQRIEKLKRTSFLAFNNNPRNAGLMASPPTITTNGTITSGNSQTVDLYTASFPTLKTSFQMDLRGGVPYSNSGNNMVVGRSTTTNTGSSGGIDGSTAKAGCYRWAFMSDAATVDVRIIGFNQYRLLVDSLDGKGPLYVSTTTIATPSAGGAQYIHIAFGARQAKGRIIFLECAGAAGLYSVHVPATCGVWAPPQGDRVSVALIGDSVGDGTGAAWPGDAFSWILADYMGIADLRQICIGGTGYINPTSPSGTAWPYGSHSSDWTSLSNLDAIVFTGGNNDAGQTATAVQTAATSLFTTTRTAQPNTPIFVFGPDSFTSPSANILAVEAGLSAAVASFADSTIQFIPLATLADGGTSELYGTGNATAPTGDGNADIYTGNTLNSDPVHPDINGHTYRGMFRASLMRKALFKM